jgi:hypothetical protein
MCRECCRRSCGAPLARLALEVSETPSHVDTDVLIDGLDHARGRFASSTPGTAKSFQAAFEVLAWVGVLRDRFRHENARYRQRSTAFGTCGTSCFIRVQMCWLGSWSRQPCTAQRSTTVRHMTARGTRSGPGLRACAPNCRSRSRIKEHPTTTLAWSDGLSPRFSTNSRMRCAALKKV